MNTENITCMLSCSVAVIDLGNISGLFCSSLTMWFLQMTFQPSCSYVTSSIIVFLADYILKTRKQWKRVHVQIKKESSESLGGTL
jgi:hypothetical protein